MGRAWMLVLLLAGCGGSAVEPEIERDATDAGAEEKAGRLTLAA